MGFFQEFQILVVVLGEDRLLESLLHIFVLVVFHGKPDILLDVIVSVLDVCRVTRCHIFLGKLKFFSCFWGKSI